MTETTVNKDSKAARAAPAAQAAGRREADPAVALPLSDIQKRFILHWGEMGTRWGINRTVAQIHALLIVSDCALNAEQITKALSVARSNVSASLRELDSWGLLLTEQRLGDRRDYYMTPDDVWEMFRIVTDKRKQREIDPTIELIQQLVAESKGSRADAHTHKRLSELLDLMRTMSAWYERVTGLPRSVYAAMAKSGAKLAKLFGGGRSGD